jgi:hypothetical protein
VPPVEAMWQAAEAAEAAEAAGAAGGVDR